MGEAERAVRRYLEAAQYSDEQIDKGLAFAREQGVEDPDDIAERAIARILYPDDQLERGAMFGWEDESVDWDEWRN